MFFLSCHDNNDNVNDDDDDNDDNDNDNDNDDVETVLTIRLLRNVVTNPISIDQNLHGYAWRKRTFL